MMFPEGVYSFENARSKFHFTTPPSNQELDKLLKSLVHRDFWKNGDSLKGMKEKLFFQ